MGKHDHPHVEASGASLAAAAQVAPAATVADGTLLDVVAEGRVNRVPDIAVIRAGAPVVVVGKIVVVPWRACARQIFDHTGQRRRGSRTTTSRMRWPTTLGRRPRRVVSTSGSSGM